MKTIYLTTLFLFTFLFASGSLFGQCIELEVFASDDESEVTVCAGSPVAIVDVKANTNAGHQLVVITDDAGIILETQFDRSVSFANAPAGVCRIYLVSYWGFVEPDLAGQAIDETEFTGLCYQVSSNYITVNRSTSIQAAMISTDDPTEICIDGVPDPITVDVTGGSGGTTGFVVTDEEQNILALSESNVFDLDPAGPGVCLIWHIVHEDRIEGLAVGNNVSQIRGCFGLSNPITVVRKEAEAGTVSTTDGQTDVEVIVGDDLADVITFASEGASDATFTYIVTDSFGIVLAIPEGNEQDFDRAAVGVCHVYGLSYTGVLTVVVTDNINDVALSDDCYDLSDNRIRVNRVADGVRGGTVAMPNGLTERITCVGDSLDDIVMFESIGATPTALFTFFITDLDSNIIGIPDGNSQNFEGAGEGVCLVWGLAYTEDLLAEVGDKAGTDPLASGEYAISTNFITVTRTTAEGGTVSTSSGGTSIAITAGDGIPNVITFQVNGASPANFTYVITDTLGVILGIPDSTTQDFEGAGPGLCYVWGLSYTGNLTAMIGDTAGFGDLSDECYDLSDNFVSVTRLGSVVEDTISGGTVAMPNGLTERLTCAGDSLDDIVMFESMGATVSALFTFFITDLDSNIIGIPEGNSQNFEGAGEGVCLVWGLAYTDSLLAMMGSNAGTDVLASGEYAISENFITVTRVMADGGMVSTSDGETEVMITAGDSIADVITFQVEGASAANFTYVITDTLGVILGVPESNSQDFEGAGEGVCYVWGLSYTGSITAMVGDTAGLGGLSDECYDLSDNFIAVTRVAPSAEDTISGGTVAMPNGLTERLTCVGDSLDDIVMFESMGATESALFTFFITDLDSNIIGIPEGSSQNFEGAGEGVCLVWGLAYTDSLLAMMGSNAGTDVLASGEYAISENYITVTRAMADGGIVSTSDGVTEVTITAGDSIADVITFQVDSASAAHFTYVITDTLGVILGVPDSTTQDFEGAGVGVCYVWGLSYTGSLIAMVGDTAGLGGLSDECYDLSDNFIAVTRVAPEAEDTTLNGGMVAMPSGKTVAYTCPGDGTDDVLMFESTNATDSVGFTFIITDPQGIVLGIPEGNTQNFEGAGEGICYVYGLAYLDSLVAVPGDNINEDTLSLGEFALSDNFVVVNRATPDAGMVMTSLGLTEVTTTPGDGQADVVEFMATGASNSNYAYIVTDTIGMILGLPGANAQDFEGAGLGVCRVWGVAYTGSLALSMGDDLNTAVISDGCFDLSDNFVSISRQEGVNGGVVVMPSGATTRYTCPGDSLDDIVMFENSLGSAEGEFAYVITDENGVILGLPGDMQNFEGAGEGVCLVWGLTYTGTLTAMVGDTATAGPLSDGDSDLSDNFITINRATPDGGMVTTMDGDTAVMTTAGDGEADVIEFASSGTSNSKFTYVITDTDGNILGLPGGNSQDFEGAGAGICLVWGLSYTGTITAVVGDHAPTTDLSDECFDLSDNFIQVNREALSLDQQAISIDDAFEQVAEAIEIEFVNPVRAFLEGAIQVNTGERTTVSLFSINGNLIKEWNLSDDPYQVMDWNLTELKAGMYILNVRSGNSMESRRLVKL